MNQNRTQSVPHPPYIKSSMAHGSAWNPGCRQEEKIMQAVHLFDAHTPVQERQVALDDDALLANRAAHGDREAFDKLVQHHLPRAYATAGRWCRDRSQVPDVVVEALTRAYRSISHFRGQCCFTTWLHRILVNCAHDANRHRLASRELSFEDGVSVDIEKRALLADFEEDDDADNREVRLQRLDAAINKLSPERRELLEELYVEGAPCAELARRHGTAVGTIKSRLFRIREELRSRVS